MPTDVLLVGGGGHGRVIGEALLALSDHFRLLGFVDPLPQPQTTARLGVPQLGDDAEIEARRDAALVLGVGGLEPRRRLAAKFGTDREWPTVVHPSAHVSRTATLGPGVVVLGSAIVNSGATLGAFTLVNSGAIIEHDVTVGQHVLFAPGTTVGGATRIEECVNIGLGATIRNGIRVGSQAVIAMGAVVVRDVPADVTEFGVGPPRGRPPPP